MIVNLLLIVTSGIVNKEIYRSTVIVSAMTMISRLMGFARDMLIAHLFGVSAATDAFFVAFKIPNFLRRLFAEGAFAQAFIPVLTDYKLNSQPLALKDFVDKTAGTLAVLLLAVSLLGGFAAPLLILIFAPGFLWEGNQYALAVDMLRITFPYIWFISLTAFSGAILNAYGRFAIPAITPLFLNLAMIAAAVWLAPFFDEPIQALAWGVILAGLVQWLFQWPALVKLGLLPRLRWGWRNEGVRRILALMIPAMFSVSVVQINLLFDTLMASFLSAGSVSWLYYSDRLVEFPLGILGIAVATVILPHLSSHHADDDKRAFSQSLDWGLKVVLLVGVPATLGLVLLSKPLVSTLFQYNEFSASDVTMSSQSLMAFASGLLAFMFIKVLVPGFTAREDTQTPVRFGLYSVVCNVVFNLLLIAPLAHAGVALATSLAAYLNAALLLWVLWKRGIYRPGRGWPAFIIRIGVASLAMSIFLLWAVDPSSWLLWSGTERGFNLLSHILIAMLVYGGVLWVLGTRLRDLLVH